MIGSRSRAAGGRGRWAAGRALALVVLLAVSALASGVEAADVDELIERAEHSYHSGDLKTAAKRFAKADRFEPARLRGEPVGVFYNLTVNFELR